MSRNATCYSGAGLKTEARLASISSSTVSNALPTRRSKFFTVRLIVNPSLVLTVSTDRPALPPLPALVRSESLQPAAALNYVPGPSGLVAPTLPPATIPTSSLRDLILLSAAARNGTRSSATDKLHPPFFVYLYSSHSYLSLYEAPFAKVWRCKRSTWC